MEIEQLGPYRISRELGRGGMGTVYEGLNVETGEPAAVKLLSAAMARQEGFRERFAAEIETLRKLHHPNIVRLFGFGTQDEQFFYAMELVDGESLEQQVSQGRRFDWREVTRMAVDVCHALRHAHDRGVIHRDIKPGNLLLTAEADVKLSDFGIARLFGNTRLTNVGSVMGTAEYMAPEQAGGEPVDLRADLYSLGGVMYVLLARRPLFTGKSLPDVIHKQRFEQPAPLEKYAPECPAALVEIVMQLLDKDPLNRVANADLLARQLTAMQRALTIEPEDGDPATTQLIEEPPPPSVAPPADELPETKLTGPIRPVEPAEVAERIDSPAPPEPDETAQPGETAPAPSHFTPVADDELDRPPQEKRQHPLISGQTWVLAASLIAVGLAAWYLLQPPSPDALYDRITSRVAGGGIESLRAAEDDVERFLTRHGDDPRSAEVREYQRELDLYRLERRFELRAKGLSGAENLIPIERDYLDAVNYARLDPDRGAAKLEALLALYGHRRDDSGPTGQCLELARRRLASLREQLAVQQAQRLALTQERLRQAGQLDQSEPERARAIYRALIELYQDKPWAAEVVEQARTALGKN